VIDEGGRNGGEIAGEDGEIGAAEEKGGDVEVDAVDEVEAEGFGEGLGAALDEEAGDSAAGEIAQDAGKGAVFIDERAVAVLVGEEVRVGREIAGAGEEDAPGLARMTDAADGEVGVIGPEGAGADEDGIDLGAEAVGIEAGGCAGEPGAFRGEAEDAGIEGEGAFGNDEGEAGEDPLVEGSVEGCGFRGEDAWDDLDAGGTEELKAAARVGGIGIGGGDDDAGEAGGDDGIDAGRGAAMGGARLEGDVEGGAARLGGAGEAAESFDLSMGGAGGAVPAAGEQTATG
jgi:hypothetical protein